MTTTLAGLFEHARLPDTDPVHARNAVAFALTIPGQLPYQGYVDVAAPRIVERPLPASVRVATEGLMRVAPGAVRIVTEAAGATAEVSPARPGPSIRVAATRVQPAVLDRLTGVAVAYGPSSEPGMLFGDPFFAAVSISYPMGTRRSFRVVISDRDHRPLLALDVASGTESASGDSVILRGRSVGSPDGPDVELRLQAGMLDANPDIR